MSPKLETVQPTSLVVRLEQGSTTMSAPVPECPINHSDHTAAIIVLRFVPEPLLPSLASALLTPQLHSAIMPKSRLGWFSQMNCAVPDAFSVADSFGSRSGLVRNPVLPVSPFPARMDLRRSSTSCHVAAAPTVEHGECQTPLALR